MSNPNHDIIIHAARRLLNELDRHSVPEVLTSDAARNDIENAIKQVKYAFQTIDDGDRSNAGHGQVQ